MKLPFLARAPTNGSHFPLRNRQVKLIDAKYSVSASYKGPCCSGWLTLDVPSCSFLNPVIRSSASLLHSFSDRLSRLSEPMSEFLGGRDGRIPLLVASTGYWTSPPCSGLGALQFDLF